MLVYDYVYLLSNWWTFYLILKHPSNNILSSANSLNYFFKVNLCQTEFFVQAVESGWFNIGIRFEKMGPSFPGTDKHPLLVSRFLCSQFIFWNFFRSINLTPYWRHDLIFASIWSKLIYPLQIVIDNDILLRPWPNKLIRLLIVLNLVTTFSSSNVLWIYALGFPFYQITTANFIHFQLHFPNEKYIVVAWY